MTSTTITLNGLTVSGSAGIQSIPGTPYVYYTNYTDPTGIYYYDSTASSPITPILVPLTNGSVTAQSVRTITSGVYFGQRYVWVSDVNASGYIWQILLHGDGTPSTISILAGTQGLQSYGLSYDGIQTLYICQDSTLLRTYTLGTLTLSPAFTQSGVSFGTVEGLKYISGAVYVTVASDNNVYKGTLSSGSVTWSVYLTFVIPGFLTDPDPSDTVYITEYGTGGASSKVYEITNFTTSPVSTDVPVTPPSVPNGFWAITSSEPSGFLYVSNYDATTSDQVAVLPLPSPPVPCFTEECEILTPSGYVSVKTLTKGDAIITPDGRTLEIHNIFSSHIRTTRENAPFRIPKDFFDKNIPSKDVVLSPNHAYKSPHTGGITLPVWTDDIKQEKIGQWIRYYHIELPHYPTDKLVCSGLEVDSWKREKKMTY